jgi:Haem-binding uptake, Tiki superfamily, ChaN
LAVKDHLLSTQKKIYQSLKAEAEQLLGETPAPILAYEKEYQKDFRKVTAASVRRLKGLKKKELIEKIRSSDVTLIGDYHTFAQAQRTALRIIRDAVRPGEEWWIGVEMVPSHFQADLDRFQAGKISLAEFHEIIDYRSEWGFPWQHYQPLFDWAREHQVRLIALNRPKELFYPFSVSARELNDLRKRDEWAAGIITDQFAAKKGRMIVLYGELHVGSAHLPHDIQRVSKYFLKRSLTCLSVHQNHDGLFWSLAQSKSPIEALKLGPANYCVFSSTPWAKLQSLVTWAESVSDSTEPDMDAESEWDDEEEDYHHWIATYSDFLSELFHLPSPEIESATVKTVDEADFLDGVFKRDRYTPLEKRALRFQIENGLRTYIPRAEMLYLAGPNSNGAAELAGIHLFRKINGSQTLFSGEPEDFYRRVLESMFGFFGSLLINPKRKCDLTKDHLRRIATIKAQKKTPALSIEREAREIAVQFKRETLDKLIRQKLRGNANRQLTTVLAAHYIGRILAKKLHQALIEDHVTLDKIRTLILKRASNSERFHATVVQKLFLAVADQRIEGSKADRL